MIIGLMLVMSFVNPAGAVCGETPTDFLAFDVSKKAEKKVKKGDASVWEQNGNKNGKAAKNTIENISY